MSNRLAFQTQLASIMEVLANAAVAEICKLVDDDYAVVSLQMSQCQRENKALKRKLHLLELKMARGNAERRLRESAMNSSRPRVQINTGDRLRESADGVFVRQMDVSLWPSRAAAGDAASELIHSDSVRSKSPDVELVEPEAVLVKEEKVESNMSQAEETEDLPLIRDDGVLERVPCGGAGQRFSVELQDTQSTSCQQTQNSSRMRLSGAGGGSGGSSRGVEKEEEEPDVVLVKVEEVEPVTGTQSQSGLSIQEGLVESSTDDYKAVLPFDEATQTSTNQLSDLQESERGFSESAAPQSTPVASLDSSCSVAVQLRVPDTNTPASPNTQQQRSSNNNPLSSEYSLFELETFFTRWAPDNYSVSAPAASCSLAADDSAECDQDGVIIVETESQPQHVLQPPQSSVRMSNEQSFSSPSNHSRVHIQPSVSQALSAGTSASTPLRMQAISSQPPWSRTSVMIRNAQAQFLQQRHNSSRITQQQKLSIPSAQTTLSSTTAALNNTDSSEKTSTSGISSTSRTLTSTMAPQTILPVRGNTATLASIEVGIAAQHQASFLARHNKNQAPSIVLGERRRKSYVCRTCGKAFSGLSNLEAHERVHTGEKPFRCETCGKRFSEAGNLKKHQRVHTGEKPFSCNQCGKRFAWICNLRTHQQSATGCGQQVMGGLDMD